MLKIMFSYIKCSDKLLSKSKFIDDLLKVMKFDNLKSFHANRIQSLFGLEKDILAQVIIKVLSVLEKNREHKQVIRYFSARDKTL